MSAATGMAHRLSLVTSAVVLDGIEMDEFAELEPYLTRRQAGQIEPAGWRVQVSAASDCGQEPGAAATPVTLAAGDPGRSRTRSSGVTDVYNLLTATHFHLDVTARRLGICLDPASLPQRLEAVQVIRGLLLGLEAASGAQFLHGGVLSVAGSGVLLLGAKEAGKTSFALSAVRANRDVALVSNDKSILRPGGIAQGLPYAVGIGPGTLSQLPELRTLATRWSGGKAMVWPSQLAPALGGRLARAVRLDQVWVIRLDLSAEQVTHRPIPAEGGTGGFLPDTLEFSNAMSPRWLYRLAGLPDPGLGPDGRGWLEELPWLEVAGTPWPRWDPAAVARVVDRRAGEERIPR
ncbi:hypothetical protein [Jatrophihabitans sp.]|uniref:hypothetical protein n=1 Tax=Jatrophihabitans sp. TaxID=1932789 RepID=UPI002C0273F8|nr:hypothetical protein [Jatrophihabitans sp.]